MAENFLLATESERNLDRASHNGQGCSPREKIMAVVSKTKGFGWIVSNEEIKSAQEKLSSLGVATTPNGALSFAGFSRAISQNKKFSGSVVCIIGGK